jgi:hypothetical protein
MWSGYLTYSWSDQPAGTNGYFSAQFNDNQWSGALFHRWQGGSFEIDVENNRWQGSVTHSWGSGQFQLSGSSFDGWSGNLGAN